MNFVLIFVLFVAVIPPEIQPHAKILYILKKYFTRVLKKITYELNLLFNSFLLMIYMKLFFMRCHSVCHDLFDWAWPLTSTSTTLINSTNNYTNTYVIIIYATFHNPFNLSRHKYSANIVYHQRERCIKNRIFTGKISHKKWMDSIPQPQSQCSRHGMKITACIAF